MKISTKGRYAVNALIEIALNQDKGPVTLSELASMQGISLSYAEQLFASLRKQGLVKGTRGPGGGFKLARNADEITIGEIIRAVYQNEASSWVEPASSSGERAASYWERLDNKIDSFLEKITLQDAIGRDEPIASSEIDRFGS
ncbi:MAG: Rrf2 family transcriptional regulator [Acidiferrobacterales bacterium]|jgi:Rrf2 family iron-sulfur cluster assembly transcriptional regulator|nr:Rrf2 family transcriptional regulator [Acidiferrobacterales bacterium]